MRDELRGLFIELSYYPCRRPNDQRMIGKFLALGHQRAGTDNAVLTDPRAVEHDRAHADQAVRSDRTAVQHGVVPDDTFRADRGGKSWVGMNRAIVLDLRPLTDLDPLVVAAQNRAPPDAGVGL